MNKSNLKRHLLDENFNLEKSYFFKELSSIKWNAIKDFLNTFIEKGKTEESALANFFGAYPALKKGSGNIKSLRKMVDEVSNEHKGLETTFESYKAIMNYVTNEFMMAKPSVLEAHFFPNEKEENYIINMIRTVKKTLDIAIFTITNDKIFAAIEEVWNNGAEVRIITDDECCTQLGSDIYKLAAMGIPVKTDNSKQFHMHHKFAILDDAVVITGSFNWTTQAAKSNQENILFFENDKIAKSYTDEYNRLWTSFLTIIKEDDAIKQIQEERERNKKNWK